MSRFENFLFHRKTLNNAVRNFQFPEDLEARHGVMLKWVAVVQFGAVDEAKEVSLHGEFLRDVFGEALGYRSMIQGGGQAWEIQAEQTIAGSGSADGALGLFTATLARVVAPIELKGAKTDLDRQKAGESAVDQGWRYANHTQGCKWVIVSNYREVRLYETSKSTAYYERFELAELAELEAFKRFYLLLNRRSFLPTVVEGDSATDRLLKEASDAQEKITDELYREYKEVRERLVNHFLFSGPKEIPNRDLVMIEKAQKLLDRVLFIAFCEDRGLLPRNTIQQAHDFFDPYYPRPIFNNFKAIFRWVDRGNPNPPISGYNGGLFQHDELLDERLAVPDPRCTDLKNLARFDFDTEVSVDVLGHIFEQSITDLEALRSEKTGQVYDEKVGQRKVQGVFYTPAWVTQYIVTVTLGEYLRRQQEKLRGEQNGEFNPAQELEFWLAYLAVLQTIRVLDPACGSGAFLIAAFDYLLAEYERVYRTIATLQDSTEVISDFQRSQIVETILRSNLHGVDLSPESVEITKLSLWLKTAVRDKPLTDLDSNIQVGNSIVDDGTLTGTPLVWREAFPAAMATGFDVVIGNPPYVRQELLSTIKPFLQQHYQSYDGVADLYTYFYEQGLKLLKPDGMLSYIVTNKWLRSGYGEPLRRFFVQNSRFEQIIDFGHAPVFADADTFPCIVVTTKTTDAAEAEVKICPVPREELPDLNLLQYVERESFLVPWSRFSAASWSLEPAEAETLMQKIQQNRTPLKEFAVVKPYRGIMTGLNEAFLINEETKNRLAYADPKSAEIMKPYLRGQDVKRWNSEWKNIWIILLKSSSNYNWAWSNSEDLAEDIFSKTFPSVYGHLKPLENQLQKRQDRGRYWWELRACAYYNLVERPKISYQVIQFMPQYALDDTGTYGNDKTYFLPTSDLYLLGLLNSPLMWWHNWRYFGHMKDEALNPANFLMESLPIAPPTEEIRSRVEPIVTRLIEITKANQQSYSEVLDWLQSRFRIAKPGQKLENFAQLSREAFIDEVRKRIPKGTSKGDRLSPQSQKETSEVYQDYAVAIGKRDREKLALEQELSTLVNQAYGLTPAEVALMWKTAPPRMPIPKPDLEN